jgi:hypothetical protein
MEAKTPRQRLQWLIDASENRQPATQAETVQLYRELRSLAGPRAPAGVRKFTNLKAYCVDALKDCCSLIDSAAARQDKIGLPRPQAASLRWNREVRRYQREVKPDSPTFENYLINAVADLIEEAGQWLKYCEAPVKRRPGRKPSNQSPEETEETCNKLFVAFKENQRFCSSQCLFRTSTRTRREKEKQNTPKSVTNRSQRKKSPKVSAS